jgi:hypothetical protein
MSQKILLALNANLTVQHVSIRKDVLHVVEPMENLTTKIRNGVCPCAIKENGRMEVIMLMHARIVPFTVFHVMVLMLLNVMHVPIVSIWIMTMKLMVLALHVLLDALNALLVILALSVVSPQQQHLLLLGSVLINLILTRIVVKIQQD